MNSVPDELLAAYAELIQKEPDLAQASGHLMSFLLDCQSIEKAIADAVTNAKSRASQQ